MRLQDSQCDTYRACKRVSTLFLGPPPASPRLCTKPDGTYLFCLDLYIPPRSLLLAPPTLVQFAAPRGTGRARPETGQDRYAGVTSQVSPGQWGRSSRARECRCRYVTHPVAIRRGEQRQKRNGGARQEERGYRPRHQQSGGWMGMLDPEEAPYPVPGVFAGVLLSEPPARRRQRSDVTGDRW